MKSERRQPAPFAGPAGRSHPTAGDRSGRLRPPAAWAAAGMGIALSVSAAALGQPATRPAGTDEARRQVEPQRAAPAPSSAIERQVIRRDEPPAGRQGEGAASKPAAAPRRGLDTSRVALAVGLTVALIVVLRLLARWLFPGAAASRSSTAVRVLARSPVSPKQQVLLLQVGRRVIVVGDCGAQMSPLAEISDPDEVAGLLGQIDSDRRPAARAAFVSFFGRARDEFDRADARAVDDEPEAQNEGAGVGGGADPATGVPERPPADLGLAAARGELSGLLERVKGLSQQFRKS